MKRRNLILMSVLLLVGLLTGCASIEDESKKAITAVENVFNAAPEKANSENGDVSFYLPSTMNIEEKDENNVILQKGSQPYILFVNPNEEPSSEVMYKAVVAEEFTIDETFTDEERFGYIKVFELEDKLYLVTVGIGGVKMTTEAKVSELSESANEMMTVVSSVNY